MTDLVMGSGSVGRLKEVVRRHLTLRRMNRMFPEAGQVHAVKRTGMNGRYWVDGRDLGGWELILTSLEESQ